MLENIEAQPHCIHVHVKSCNKVCLNLDTFLYQTSYLSSRMTFVSC